MRGMGKENKEWGRKRCSFIGKVQIQSQRHYSQLCQSCMARPQGNNFNCLCLMPTICMMSTMQISQSALKLVEKRCNINMKQLHSYVRGQRKSQNSNEVFPTILLKQLFQQRQNPKRNTQLISVLKVVGTSEYFHVNLSCQRSQLCLLINSKKKTKAILHDEPGKMPAVLKSVLITAI